MGIKDRQRYPWRPVKGEVGEFPDVPKEIVLLPLRVFLAVAWFRAGIEKIIRETWWNGHDLERFLTKQHDLALAFWRPMMENILRANAISVSFFIVVGELAIGIAIGLNKGMTAALRFGILFNVVFVLCGVVNPSAFYLVMEIVLLSAVTDRAVGMKKKHGQHRILLQAGMWFIAAALFLPFIRTVQPSELIADPASMLSLMAGIMGSTLVYRWFINYRYAKIMWDPPKGKREKL